MKIHNKFMRLAIKKASAGIKKGQTPFGACIVKNGKIISCEHNNVWANTDITAHAEIKAIRQACRKLKTINLSGCILYSTCEPCPMCFSACHWAKIHTIIYGANIYHARKSGFNELNISNLKIKKIGKSSIKIIRNHLLDENIKLFEKWSKYKRKRTY